ncbi:hypothetical protein E1B28_002379 [Marasmius oreades]|uniref:Glyoxalase-like domain-containing protein n=1 Tax=Marasmius oreades TaxID=181124 RepID=A0A9P7RNI6_9AGAR|nr:uncharacterized protein E1B28_002379 [Marasmius oreades]KAG7086425.1 hypothetical protein E1B28_002379 [Marasmius oreades]
MSPSISTRTLDHIVHMTSPGSVEETAEQFRKLGFNVLPGGRHADGLTENALIVLQDGVYLELISFVLPFSSYPRDSPERQKRAGHRWAKMPNGWIDYAFLGNGSKEEGSRISDIINNRARADGSHDLYSSEHEGGRERPDGKVLKWLISSSLQKKHGILPFFCGDVTDRTLRVPVEPPSNLEHPCSAVGIAHVHVTCSSSDVDTLVKEFTYVIGDAPKKSNASRFEWELDTSTPSRPSHLIVDAADIGSSGLSISELGIYVERVPDEDSTTTPFGRIFWVKA